MMTDRIFRTVKELRDALAELPDDMVPFAHEPPFTGVHLVPQEDHGSVLIASLWSTEEGARYRAKNYPAKKAGTS